MKTSLRQLALLAFFMLTLAMSAQEKPIQNEYVAPETEQVDTPDKPTMIGAGVLMLILIALAVRKRRMKKKKARAQ